MKREQLQKICVTAMFCTLAFLMTFVFRFKVDFLTFDLKDAILSIVAMLYGPIYGLVSAALVAFLEFLSFSDTGFYGLIMNFISSGTFAFVCGIFYKYKRNFFGAIFAAVLAAFTTTGVMMVVNIFITPLFKGVPTQVVIQMLPTLFLPFNLVKTVINASSLLIIYKPFTTALKKAKIIKSGDVSYKFSYKSLILTIVAFSVIVAMIIYILCYMNGEFLWHK